MRRAHRLPCDGATILAVEDHRLPVVRFALALPRGAAGDPEGQTGLTYAASELMFRGTAHKDRQTFNMALETLGSAVDTSVGSDTTMLGGVALQRHLEKTLALVCEALTEPAFGDEQRKLYVHETISELRAARDDDNQVAAHFLYQAFYAETPWHHPLEGEVADIMGLTSAALRHHHRALWCRQGAVIAFAGAIDAATAERLGTELLTALTDDSPQPTPKPVLRRPTKREILLVDKPDRTQVQMRLFTPGLAGNHPDILPFWLGVVAFGGTFTAPFCREVRDKRGWSYVAHAGFYRGGLHTRPVIMESAPAQRDAIDCLMLELALFDQLVAGEIADEAVALARSHSINRHPFSIATAHDLLDVEMRHAMLGLPPDEIQRFVATLEGLPTEVCLAALRDHLKAQAAQVVLVATAQDVLPHLTRALPDATIEVVDFREGLELNGASDAI